MERTRVLVVAGSANDRRVLSRRLAREPDMQVVGAACDERSVRDLVFRARPDVMIVDGRIIDAAFRDLLDEMLAQRAVPVVVLESHQAVNPASTLRSGERSCVEVVQVGEVDQDFLLDRLAETLRRVRQEMLGEARGSATPREQHAVARTADLARTPGRCVVAIGASTGGTAAIETVLRSLPANCPPVVVCQHMPAAFTAPFARRLDAVCDLRVLEVDTAVPLGPGVVAVAPGDRHMVVAETEAGVEAVVTDGSPVHHQKPAVDVLFRSLATTLGSRGIGVLLTGMGQDGAAGLLEMRSTGAHTIAQDESTSAVYGMPREAVTIGAVVEVLRLDDVADGICRAAVRLAQGGPDLRAGGRVEAEAEVAATQPRRRPRAGT
ncbi:MAG: chemotaxis response regulator protein-glutamate methylesterase [Acidimicrobiia bacterium]|nr:chemotaxis response regulator protein-glutamate methylesterase [Acidimicrobiia bacterium]